jgi:hypothetical protein
MQVAVRHPDARTLRPSRGRTRSPRGLARAAGLAYLALAVCSGFAHAAATSFYLPDDASATAAALAGNPAFVRIAVVADLAGATAWVLFVLVLARLLREFDRHAAMALVVFSSLGAGITMVNAALEFAAMRVATGAVDLSALGGGGSNAAALLLLDLHHYGMLVAAVFMGLWLFPFGVLVVRSRRMLPGWIGALLVAGGVCYLVHVLTAFLVPDAHRAIEDLILIVPTVPEVAMVLYLLVVGVRPPRAAPAGIEA